METNELHQSLIEVEGLGKRIAARRKAAHLSQRVLAGLVEIRPERLARLEQGKISQPRLRECACLALALSMRLEDLVFEDPQADRRSA